MKKGKMKEKRCAECGALLFKFTTRWFYFLIHNFKKSVIEIKCRKCKSVNRI